MIGKLVLGYLELAIGTRVVCIDLVFFLWVCCVMNLRSRLIWVAYSISWSIAIIILTILIYFDWLPLIWIQDNLTSWNVNVLRNPVIKLRRVTTFRHMRRFSFFMHLMLLNMILRTLHPAVRFLLYIALNSYVIACLCSHFNWRWLDL